MYIQDIPDENVNQFKSLIVEERYVPSDDLQINRKNLPTYEYYHGVDGGYVAVYTNKKDQAIYGVGGGIYVAGLVRVQGKYCGRIFIPTGYFPGDDITKDPVILDICKQYFPGLGENIWIGGDTGGFFGIFNSSNRFGYRLKDDELLVRSIKENEELLPEVKTTVDLSNLHLRSWNQNIIKKIQWVVWQGEMQGLITLADDKKLFCDEFSIYYLDKIKVGDHINITQEGHNYYISGGARLAGYSLSAEKDNYLIRD